MQVVQQLTDEYKACESACPLSHPAPSPSSPYQVVQQLTDEYKACESADYVSGRVPYIEEAGGN